MLSQAEQIYFWINIQYSCHICLIKRVLFKKFARIILKWQANVCLLSRMLWGTINHLQWTYRPICIQPKNTYWHAHLRTNTNNTPTYVVNSRSKYIIIELLGKSTHVSKYTYFLHNYVNLLHCSTTDYN